MRLEPLDSKAHLLSFGYSEEEEWYQLHIHIIHIIASRCCTVVSNNCLAVCVEDLREV